MSANCGCLMLEFSMNCVWVGECYSREVSGHLGVEVS